MSSKPKIILALDAATSSCSVALWSDGTIVAHRFLAMMRGQSEALLPMVGDVLAEAGIEKPDLIAVTVGPGAFTGIRIGLAAARGLSLAWNVPIAGIATTHALAATLDPVKRQGHRIVVVLDSKREDRWVQVFDQDLNPITPPHSLMPDLIPALRVGPTIVLDDPDLHTDAVIVARLAADAWDTKTALPPQPLYLRPADVTMPSAS
jgi:tRNA threonylcarbamoyladenosine biosynthesis protein TsaB